MDLGNYTDLLEKRRAQHPQDIRYSFQELGIEMEKFFGNKKCWPLFYKYGEEELRLAFGECKKYNKPFVPYLIKVIKNKHAKRT